MSDEKEKSISEITTKLPPFDQVPDAQSIPTLKRKTQRLDVDEPQNLPVQPHLDLGQGDNDICAMPPGEVFTNLDLVNRGCKEFDRQANILNIRLEDIRADLKRISQISFLLNKHQQRLMSMNPKNPRDEIKAFQDRTQERKMAAVEKANQFLKGGTTLKDMQKQLTPQSQLDQSYKRPGGFGQKRPIAGPLHKPQTV